MKIGIIAPANIWFSPYLKIYTKILDKIGVKYEIVFWDRDGSEEGKGLSFSRKIDNGWPRWKKLWFFIRYIHFVKQTISTRNYNRLIIFGPQIGIIMARYLRKKYKNNYIFDFRDLSIEQYRIFRPRFKALLANSAFNVISSPGFKRYLPEGNHYIISHNFDIDSCKDVLSKKKYTPLPNNPIIILTIGGIRDYSSNSEVIHNLCNQENMMISFVGKGSCATQLKKYGDYLNCRNISFEGFYPKEKEKEYILSCTFLNIFYPKIKSHSSALSNRFYNALVYKRPMIVTSNSIQGDYVEQNNLGLSLETCDGLADKIKKWIQENDFNTFCHRCDVLLNEFITEQESFIHQVEAFVTKEKS